MNNFYIKIHYGEKIPFYKSKSIDFFKSQSFKDLLGRGLVYKEFDANFLQIIRFRQLIHSQSLCEYLPLKVDLELKDEVLKSRISELKEQYEGVFDSEIDWRLAIGFGQASVFETSITLHHIYGIPYIPASAVKGILRSWIITEYFQKKDNIKNPLINAEFEALGNRDFCKIFGCPAERQAVKIENNEPKKNKNGEYEFEKPIPSALATEYMGDIIFFDAFPTKPPIVSVDIMNPHYQPYYSDETNKIPPADWHSPVPIFFLTVKDTGFQFLFGIRKGRENFEVEFGKHKGSVIKVLKELLTEALTQHGIGAKTAVGYGRFKKP